MGKGRLCPADCEFEWVRVLALQRMAGLTGRTAAWQVMDEGPVWAAQALELTPFYS